MPAPLRTLHHNSDHDIGCAGCRARTCPVPGHPCLSSVPIEAVVAAVDRLAAPVPVGAAS